MNTALAPPDGIAPPRMTALRIGTPALAMIALATTMTIIGYHQIFSLFADYDDEGYMLISLRGVAEGGALYDEVFSQYGPFYFFFWNGIFRLGGLELVHDNARLVTLGVWIATSLLLGLSIWRLTGSALLGIATQLVAFLTQGVLINEPLHPGGLLSLLLTLVVVATAFLLPRRREAAMLAIGGLTAATVLVKVNVGGYLAIAAAFAAAFTLTKRLLPRIAVAAVATLIPLAVMAGDLGERWALRYALSVSLAAAAISLVASKAARVPATTGRDLRSLVAGAGIVTVVTCGAAVLGGTSISGLVNGILLRPLRQADVFSLPAFQPDFMIPAAATGLGAAAIYALASTRWGGSAGTRLVGSVTRIVLGLGMLVALSGRLSAFALPFSLVLPVAWLTAAAPQDDPLPPFARLGLPMLGVLQALHAYPVAGSQSAWSSLFLVPLAAIVTADGARGLRDALPARARPAAILPTLGLGVWLLITRVVPMVGNSIDGYRAGESLDLPGTSRLHVSADQAWIYPDLVRILRERCGTLVTLPGMNSIHLFSGVGPPTGFNATAWMFLFDERDQARIAEALERSPRPCVVHHPGLAAFWAQGRAVPRRPLVAAIERGYHAEAMVGPFEILTPGGAGAAR